MNPNLSLLAVTLMVQAANNNDQIKLLKKGKNVLAAYSNGGYHYFGNAKILSQIGKACAEAILKIQTTNGVHV
jgi:hypothetical protein